MSSFIYHIFGNMILGAKYTLYYYNNRVSYDSIHPSLCSRVLEYAGDVEKGSKHTHTHIAFYICGYWPDFKCWSIFNN